MKYILFLIVLAGCAAPRYQWTDASRKVQVINTSIATKCKHLGMVVGWAPYLSGGMPYAQIDARNDVAKLGGNALVIHSATLSPRGHAEINGDAYLCP